MRKVYVEVKTRLVIRADDDQDITDVLENMTYAFDSTSDGADIEDSEIRDWKITDSK